MKSKPPLNTLLYDAKEQLQIARQLQNEGKYGAALEICEQILPIFEQGQDWEALVHTLNLYGNCMIALEKAQQAREVATHAVNTALKHLGELHIHTAMAYHILGTINLKTGQFDDALLYFNKCLAIRQQILGNNASNIGTVLTEIGALYTAKGQFQTALDYLQQALSILVQANGELHLDTGNCYTNIAVAHWYMGNYPETVYNCHKSLYIRQQLLGEQHLDTAISYNNLGNAYCYLGDFDHAIAYEQKGLSIHQNINALLHANAANLYHNLGNAYYQKGDFDHAIIYTEKGLHIRLQILGELHRTTALSYHNLGAIFWSKEDYESTLFYYEKSLEIRLQLFGELHKDSADSYHNLGALYDTWGKHEKALQNCQKGLEIRLKTIGKQHPDVASSYNNMASVYCAAGNYNKALTYCQMGFRLWQKTLGKQHFNLARSRHNLAHIYFSQENFGQAAKIFQKSLSYLIADYQPTSIYRLPLLQNYKLAPRVLATLVSFAESHFLNYQTNGQNPQDLLAAWYTINIASQLTDQMRQSYRAEGSKLTLAKLAKTTHQIALQISHEVASKGAPLFNRAYKLLCRLNPKHLLPHPQHAAQHAFMYSEKSKAMVLLSNLKDTEARFTAGIPLPLLEKEKELRIQITFWEKRILTEEEKKAEHQNHQNLTECKNRFFELKSSYDDLVALFEQNYPDYFTLKYQTNIPNPNSLQAALPPNTFLIEYFITPQFIFIFAVFPNKFRYFCLPKPNGFDDDIKDFLHFGIGAFDTRQINKKEYLHFGHTLFQTLLEPVLQELPNATNPHLIIIPDGILCSLPFETLLTRACQTSQPYASLPYLICQYSISYHLSAALWLYQQQKQQNNKQTAPTFTYLGMAPVYHADTAQDNKMQQETEKIPLRQEVTQTNNNSELRSRHINNKTWNTLPFSETEVTATEKLFAQAGLTTGVFLHNRATLSAFVNHAAYYRYIHIAAHGDLNVQKPELTGIIFSPDDEAGADPVFYMADAYNLQLNANLVVLSCCDSGVGKEIHGEGVLAMNRGFLYAGAQNVIHTLFKVQDQHSSQLVQILFEHILKGDSYRQALKQAKQNMIEQNYPPIYWSGYVLIEN